MPDTLTCHLERILSFTIQAHAHYTHTHNSGLALHRFFCPSKLLRMQNRPFSWGFFFCGSGGLSRHGHTFRAHPHKAQMRGTTCFLGGRQTLFIGLPLSGVRTQTSFGLCVSSGRAMGPFQLAIGWGVPQFGPGPPPSHPRSWRIHGSPLPLGPYPGRPGVL